MTTNSRTHAQAMPRGDLLLAGESLNTSSSTIATFARIVGKRHGRPFDSYLDLWSWSVDEPDAFWAEVVEFFDLRIEGADSVLGRRTAPRPEWFPGGRTSYPEHVLRTDIAGPAIIGVSQSRSRIAMSMQELRDAVAQCRAGLLRLGVSEGDRVVAYVPNIPEAVIAMLATASLGAVWASCPPEFGARAVVDRLAQITPTVLLAVDGYQYGSKHIDRRDTVAVIRESLPTLKHTVMLDYTGNAKTIPDCTTWVDLLSEPGELAFARVPFDHPLYVLFSSGTTGLPKAIVHGHGGILLEHAKAIGLQNDVRLGDCFFWQSTTGWMVWNYAISCLLLGATMVCFDGDPNHPDTSALWQLIADESVTYFGTSAGHLMASRTAGLTPGASLDVGRLRGLGSTGSPLPPEGFVWVYQQVSSTVRLTSVSGGTDVCSAFVGGSPLCDVRAGEISAPTLGADVAALNGEGHRLIEEFGELSVLTPMPSMPVSLWGDDERRTRLHDTYYSQHGGVWSHGDWVLFHPDMSCVIAGRSDATLNRGGVRLGTAEFYSVLDGTTGVEDCVVVHLDDEGTGRLILLVATGSYEQAPDPDSLRALIKAELSPRHVPDVVIAVSHLPRTLTGKRLEKPIKKILLGAAPDSVVSRGSVTSPDALDELAALGRQLAKEN